MVNFYNFGEKESYYSFNMSITRQICGCIFKIHLIYISTSNHRRENQFSQSMNRIRVSTTKNHCDIEQWSSPRTQYDHSRTGFLVLAFLRCSFLASWHHLPCIALIGSKRRVGYRRLKLTNDEAYLTISLVCTILFSSLTTKGPIHTVIASSCEQMSIWTWYKLRRQHPECYVLSFLIRLSFL